MYTLNLSQEISYIELQQYSKVCLIKKNSYESFYDELADLKVIRLEQQGFEKDFEEFQDIISDNQLSKKNSFFSQNSKSNIDIDLGYTIDPEVKRPSKPSKFAEKSFCRYILLYVFRTIENQLYAEVIRDICSRYQINYNDFKLHYKKARILIMGYQGLKKELIYEQDDIPIQNRKKAFKDFLFWYLDKLATKHILLSKKQDFKGYLKFKNYVMSYYIHAPKSWLGNKSEWK